ncbi:MULTISPECIES: ribosomal-processing cysteine protease Prp [Facklamia]|uniref:Ribosomal processing cysteine protease Prp n=1 Tax=Facklamia hominis TaxID=178214 RepID=A0AAJ1Q4A5_9LACT|nr:MULTISPECIES: ribosomal-processing cysteine protease Prp [Facklamia]MDK7187165.1 ribosomal-processing cysteine protease Prp [Facklamia hominis]OFL65111.1 hypothetical protein HMPREF2758_02835 [Facklamia sp. HMSC062C11]
MIRIQIGLSSDQKQVRFIELKGHAEMADPGLDIVCAAVSSQIISLENSLYQLMSLETEVEIDDVHGGYLNLTIPHLGIKNRDHDIQLLCQHVILALTVTQESYPEYIQIKQVIA